MYIKLKLMCTLPWAVKADVPIFGRNG